jgi:hypothetical protein
MHRGASGRSQNSIHLEMTIFDLKLSEMLCSAKQKKRMLGCVA